MRLAFIQFVRQLIHNFSEFSVARKLSVPTNMYELIKPERNFSKVKLKAIKTLFTFIEPFEDVHGILYYGLVLF